MHTAATNLRRWALDAIEHAKASPRVLVRDPLGLLPLSDGDLHRFALDNDFVVVEARTNLAFRELYSQALADPETHKLLVIDRAPPRRSAQMSSSQSPALFYPDLLARTPAHARITLDLRQFLRDVTGDPDWPGEVNDQRYARLIIRHLDGVLRAHRNLRIANARRFTDHDFKTIIAFAALGVAESAFNRLKVEDYWKIGLLGLDALAELDSLTPEITTPVKDELKRAPEPFRWFIDRDPEVVVRAFYLSVILSQHIDNWTLLLANIDPTLRLMSSMSAADLADAAHRLADLDPTQAHQSLDLVEQNLDQQALQLLLIDQRLHPMEVSRFRN